MKIIIATLIALMFIGCGPLCKTSCPPEDVYIQNSFGIPIQIPKGFLDKRENYGNQEQYDKWYEEKIEREINRGLDMEDIIGGL